MKTIPSGSSVRPPWVYRATTLQIVLTAIVFGSVIWAIIAGMDLLTVRLSEKIVVPMAAVDSIVGLGCGVLLFKLMMSRRAHFREVAARLRLIGEINHHIRNALDRIELTAHVTHNRQLIDDIGGGVERIQWVLKELLPEAVAEPEDDDGSEET